MKGNRFRLPISLIILGWAFFVNSCSFNWMFFQPTKIPKGVTKFAVKTPKDTMWMVFSNGTYQPVFFTKNKDTIKQSFDLSSVVFISSDGDSLNGWFMRSKTVKPQVTLLHCHGNAGFVLSQYQGMMPFLDKGFQVFIFDYSGYGFSTGRPTRKNVLKDAISAVKYIKSRPEVAGTKLVIYGQSLGGHLSAVVAEREQEEIDGLVMEGAFSSCPDMGAHVVPVLGRLLVKKSYSANESIRKFHKPVLIIHSTEDEVVPFYMGKKLFERANTPKEFYEIKHCHICGPEYYSVEIAGKIKMMLGIK